MGDSDKPSNKFDSLHRKAERILKERQTESGEFAELSLTELIHEIEIHRIQLQIQNEELESTGVELKESRNQYAELYEHAPVGYVNLNSRGLIVRCNAAAREMLGITVKQRRCHRFSALIDPEDQGTLRAVLRKLRKDGGEVKGTCEIRTARKFESGDPRFIQMEVTALTGAEGKLSGWHITCVDISERKEAQKERRRLVQRLQVKKMASLNRMAGAIAHNFNNMLAIVQGNLELALHELPRESAPRTRVAAAIEASKRAAEVSRFMLTCLGQTTSRKEPIDLSEVVAETFAFFRSSLLPKKIKLNAELLPTGSIVLADRAQMKQVLTNLLSNAMEAIGEKEGAITVVTRVMRATDVRDLRVLPLDWEPKAENYVCLSVSDNGCGVNAASEDEIFDPFFSTKFKGRGLGLPVAMGLVLAHEGAMSFENKPGRGATFRVLLPLLAKQELPFRDERTPARPIESAGLVLVVDDEPMFLDAVEEILKELLGYEVITAGDGFQAVEIFSKRKDEISAVLLDLRMPGMDGWQVLDALRALRPDIHVILASGHDEAQALKDYHREQPQAFLHKPFRVNELGAALGAARKPFKRG